MVLEVVLWHYKIERAGQVNEVGTCFHSLWGVLGLEGMVFP